MTWRVWLNTGRYVLVDAEDEKEVLKKLTRTQRQRMTKVMVAR